MALTPFFSAPGACPLCAGLQLVRAGDPRLVAELGVTTLVLADDQSRPGRVMLLARGHEAEPDHDAFMADLSLAMKAVRQAVRPARLNTVGSLGAADAGHLVWHLVPRFDDDPAPDEAVWERLPGHPAEPEVYARIRRDLLRSILAERPVTRLRA